MIGLREAGISRITLGSIRSHNGGFSLVYLLNTRFVRWLDQGERVVAVPVAHGGRGLRRSRVVYRRIRVPECYSYLLCRRSVKRDEVWRLEKRVYILYAEEKRQVRVHPLAGSLANNVEAQTGKEQQHEHRLTWLAVSDKIKRYDLEGRINWM